MNKTITIGRPVRFTRSVDVQPTPEAERKDPMQVPRPATPPPFTRHAHKPSVSTFDDESDKSKGTQWVAKAKLWVKDLWHSVRGPRA